MSPNSRHKHPSTPAAQSSCCSLLDKGQLSWELSLRRGEARRGQARQCCSCREVVCISNSRGTSLRNEYSKAEQPAFLYPVVKWDFRKGSLHNCVHLTNMYLFLVYGSALHFLYPELHYLITNQKHIGPKQRLLYSQAEIAMKYPVFTTVRQTCYS